MHLAHRPLFIKPLIINSVALLRYRQGLAMFDALLYRIL